MQFVFLRVRESKGEEEEKRKSRSCCNLRQIDLAIGDKCIFQLKTNTVCSLGQIRFVICVFESERESRRGRREAEKSQLLQFETSRFSNWRQIYISIENKHILQFRTNTICNLCF